jgi:hypothetical protein
MEYRDFGWALNQLRSGHAVCRAGWNGKGMWLRIQRPDEHSKMTEPYIYMRTATGGKIPWNCSQADMLADDYQLVEGAV